MSTKTSDRTVGVVEIVELPDEKNGMFYVVKDDKGVHYYVSALGGRVASGTLPGTKYNLVVSNPSKAMTIYVLTPLT